MNDPELRFAPSGVAVGKFRLVADQKKKVNDEWVDDKVLWLSVTCFKQLAEHCADSLRQGDLVMVTGKLQTDEWETEQGEKRSAVALVANNIAPSLLFRNIPHTGDGGGRRVERSTAPTEDKWSTPEATSGGGAAQPDDPPF